MSEAAFEEVSVLSSIYCREGEFRLVRQSSQDGLLVQISCSDGGDRGLNVDLVFHLQPSYPSCPPDISVSSTHLSRTQCDSIRQKLLERAAGLSPEPMVHQLVQYCQQCMELTGDEAVVKGSETEEDWTAVLLLDHIRSLHRYVGLVERWSQQLQLTGRLLLGPTILIILQGAKRGVKEFCRRLKTTKVDVDSAGKKCKERMMSVLLEVPSPSSPQDRVQGFEVKNYVSSAELAAAFQELRLTGLYEQILPTLK